MPPSHFPNIHFHIILLSMPVSIKWSHSLRFLTKTLYAPLLTPIRATCHTHFILLDLISPVIFGEEYKVLNSSLCSCLHSPDTSSLVGPNMLLVTLFSNTVSLSVSDHVSHLYKNNRQNYRSVYPNFYICG